VELVITADGRLKQARLNGKAVDPKAEYRIATLDYVAQGNDKMPAFKSKTDVKMPLSEENNVRFMVMDYFRAAAARGEAVSAAVEGRIKAED
jgi:2',3'-cyclic-nucleotide 2'-phosphodiesterase (5'-nucleotidase family)